MVNSALAKAVIIIAIRPRQDYDDHGLKQCRFTRSECHCGLTDKIADGLRFIAVFTSNDVSSINSLSLSLSIDRSDAGS